MQDRVLIIGSSKEPAVCARCGGDLFSYTVDSGWLYILSNPRIPGLLKIGMTTRHIDDRIQELNAGTGVPAPFKLEALFVSESAATHEKQVFESLEERRESGKEFFRVSLDEALAVAKRVTGDDPCLPTAPTPSSGLLSYVPLNTGAEAEGGIHKQPQKMETREFADCDLCGTRQYPSRFEECPHCRRSWLVCFTCHWVYLGNASRLDTKCPSCHLSGFSRVPLS